MSIELKVTELRKFQKRLKGLVFSLVPIKDKKCQYRLRLGKKYIMIDCPSKEIGENLKNAIMAVFRQTDAKVCQIIHYIEHNAEQITMELFPETEEGGNDGNQGSCNGA